MATPTEFPEMNMKWTGQGDVGDLPVHRNGAENISRWELTAEELAEVQSTGVVWLRVWGNHPAVYVSGESPFTSNDTGLHDNAINEWADELFGESPSA